MHMFLPRRYALCLTLSALIGLGACSDAPQHSEATSETASAASAANNDYPFGLACGWEVASNIDTMNIAFPDESAKYWVALVPMLPQTRLRIDGRFPEVRYFSYNVYDPILRPTDALADSELEPAAGDENPFTDPSAEAGGAYTAYVEFTAKPDDPAPNTVYAGAFGLGEQSVPQVLMTALFYRVYVPDEGRDFDGGVGLPKLTFETADGHVEILPTANCVEPLLPTFGGTLGELGLNDILRDVDVIDDPFLQSPGAVPLGTPEAETKVFYGLPQTAINLLRDFVGLPLPDDLETQLPLPAGGGFLSNIHNAYTTNLFSRSYGNVVMIRAKAPRFRGQNAVPFGQEQVRYWSVCQNDLPTQRYVGCTADYQAHPDADGYFTMMVTDTADRPANAMADNNIDWMPWGPYIDALLIYRHMLPASTFDQAIQNVPQGTLPGDLMGDYVPQSAYCQKDIAEAAGDTAADIFAACRAYTETLARGSMLNRR